MCCRKLRGDYIAEPQGAIRRSPQPLLDGVLEEGHGLSGMRDSVTDLPRKGEFERQRNVRPADLYLTAASSGLLQSALSVSSRALPVTDKCTGRCKPKIVVARERWG